MKNRKIILSVALISLIPLSLWSQKSDSTYTPYELLSTYYNEQFHPFKKKNIYLGLAFSLEDKKVTNTDYLIQEVIDGDRLDFNINLKGGYYTGDYGMVGITLNYYQKNFEGTVFSDPDTALSKSITRGYALTPNFRSSVPLTPNERLSFFTQIGITFGMGNTLSHNTKNLDEINRTYTTSYDLRVGISPGITFFAMENFAFEVQLDLLGYALHAEKKTVNGGDESSQIRQNIDFNINILSLQLGLAYYFRAGKK